MDKINPFSLNILTIIISLFICFINYILAIKFFYIKFINSNKKNSILYVILYFIIRIFVLIVFSYCIVKFTDLSINYYFISLFLFYFIFKILEIIKLNKIKNS